MAKVVIVTQARLESSRFKEKILKRINGKTLLQIHLERLKKSTFSENLIVATTFEEKIDSLINITKALGVKHFQGSTNDILDRFYQATSSLKPDFVVRVTSDCPLIDPVLIDNIIKFSKKHDQDYVSNTLIEAYPDGQDIEVIKWSAFKKAWECAETSFDREHVTPFIKSQSTFFGNKRFTSLNYDCKKNYNHIRMTVDEVLDFEAIKIIIDNLGDDKNWLVYTNFIIQNKGLFKNQQIIRNEGSKNKS